MSLGRHGSLVTPAKRSASRRQLKRLKTRLRARGVSARILREPILGVGVALGGGLLIPVAGLGRIERGAAVAVRVVGGFPVLAVDIALVGGLLEQGERAVVVHLDAVAERQGDAEFRLPFRVALGRGQRPPLGGGGQVAVLFGGVAVGVHGRRVEEQRTRAVGQQRIGAAGIEHRVGVGGLVGGVGVEGEGVVGGVVRIVADRVRRVVGRVGVVGGVRVRMAAQQGDDDDQRQHRADRRQRDDRRGRGRRWRRGWWWRRRRRRR